MSDNKQNMYKNLKLVVTLKRWNSLHILFRKCRKTTKMHKFSHFLGILLEIGFHEASRDPSRLERGELFQEVLPGRPSPTMSIKDANRFWSGAEDSDELPPYDAVEVHTNHPDVAHRAAAIKALAAGELT